MTQQTEQICFRYDGSEEAKEALEWMNEKNETAFVGIKNKYYTNDGNCYNNILRTYRLVTPAEFLRLVKGEPEWTPKYGEEVEVSDCSMQGKWVKKTFLCYNTGGLPVCQDLTGMATDFYHHLRPVRKSVREEIIKLINQLNPLCLPYKVAVVADEILSKFNVTPKH